MRPRVFVTQALAERAMERLRAVADGAENDDPLRQLTKAELGKAVQGCDDLVWLMGSAVTSVREQMALIVADNAVASVRGRRPPNWVNAEVLG